MRPTVVTPLRAVAAVILAAAVATAVAASRGPGAADAFAHDANRFVVAYDLLQEDLAAAPTLAAGLATLEAGVASLRPRLDTLRGSHDGMRGGAGRAEAATDLLVAADGLVAALAGLAREVRRGDLAAARRLLAEEDRARAAYDTAVAELG